MRDATRTALSRVPTPILLLAAGAIAAQVGLRHSLTQHTVTHIVNVALVVILLDGGMHLGLGRVRQAAAPILLAGLPGTFLTALGAALVARMGFGWSWWVSLLVGTAVAPTDPAVVFSVLGGQEIEGRTDTILEGESGANDPVGIALMAGLLSAGGVSGGAFGHVAREFVLQMVVGAAVGVVCGLLLRQLRLLDPPGGRASQLVPVLAAAFGAYELAVLLDGSGFLAVFLAGILIGGVENPHQQAIDRFHGRIAGLGEIVAFIVLGLTVDLRMLGRTDVLVPGLVLAVLLALVIRPIGVGLCLSRVALARGERGFVLWAGLKGAVPLLLGSSLLTAAVPHPPRLYGVVVVVVAFSVLVQGGLLPYVAVRLGLELHPSESDG